MAPLGVLLELERIIGRTLSKEEIPVIVQYIADQLKNNTKECTK